jgi:hypothetical protein
MNQKELTKVEAAVGSAARVFCYAAAAFLASAIILQNTTGGSQVPDLATLKTWAIGACYAGFAALVAFAKNMLAPRSQIVAGTPQSSTPPK